MASTVMQEQQPAAAVPDERQSTAPGDATAAGSLPQVPLVGKPLGQLPGEPVGPAGPSISSPTPTVGIGAAQSQPVPVPGHMGTCIGLPGFMAFGGPFPGVPMAASMPEGNPLMWAPPAAFPHGMDMATSLMAHMAMADGGGYADDPRASSGLSVESLDSSASLALYWPVPPSTFALSPDDLAALQADPATLQAYQTAMLDAGVPYSGYPLGMSDNEMSMSGALAGANMATEGGASPQVVRTPTAVDKRRGPRSSTSKFRGVSCYKRTGRWESHIWSNGKQVHLGSFRLPEEAARAYDMAAICFRGWDCETNFPPVLYRDDCVLAWHMQNDTTEQYIAWLRRGGKEPNSLGVLPSAADGQGMMAAPAEAADDASLPATDTTGLASLVTQSATDEALQAANPPDAPAAVAADADGDFVSFAREVVLG